MVVGIVGFDICTSELAQLDATLHRIHHVRHFLTCIRLATRHLNDMHCRANIDQGCVFGDQNSHRVLLHIQHAIALVAEEDCQVCELRLSSVGSHIGRIASIHAERCI